MQRSSEQLSKTNSLTKIFCLVYLVFFLTGCGTVRHTLTLTPGYQPKTGTRVDVGKVSNETGKTFEVDVEKFLSDALTEELRRGNLLWTGDNSPQLKVTSQVVDYKPGNAFKRWLLPGWGSTVLTVHSDLLEDGRLVGSAEARRTISIGGGYTIGAWRTVFASIAKDLVSDLRTHMSH